MDFRRYPRNDVHRAVQVVASGVIEDHARIDVDDVNELVTRSGVVNVELQSVGLESNMTGSEREVVIYLNCVAEDTNQ